MSVHCTQLRICCAELASREAECEYEHVAEPAGGVRVEGIHRIDRLRLDRGDMVRVGGDAVCEVCGFKYYDHPTIQGARFLQRACDGRLIKT